MIRERNIQHLRAVIVLLFCSTLSLSALAAPLSISSASWSSRYNRLTASGTAGKNAAVALSYAPSGKPLLTVNANSRGNWSATITQPATVPCRIRATSAGASVERNVSNAPSNCDRSAANATPLANAGSDQVVMLAAGQSTLDVTLDGSGSSDPDGTIAGYTWLGSPDPDDVVKPVVSLASGSYDFLLTVTDNLGAASTADSVHITVNPAPTPTPKPNQPPTANAGKNKTVNIPLGSSDVVVVLDGSGSADTDGSIVKYTWTGNPDPADEVKPSVKLASGGYTFTLMVTDDKGATSTEATVNITVNPPPVSCNPVPANAQQAHASCIQSYTGPEACVFCHEQKAIDMHGSVHYQEGGPFPNVTNIPASFAKAGKRPAKAADELVADGLNTYCGSPTSSPRFTCANCHVGNGRFPMAQSDFEKLPPGSEEAHKQLANIDCMMCHQEVYKRFPNPAAGFMENLTLENVIEQADGTLVASIGAGQQVVRTGLKGIPVLDQVTQDFQFIPSDPTNPDLAGLPTALMPITALEAARTVHPTTRKSCLNCHAGAAGANGAKRGDISTALISPPIEMDAHMSPAGANHTCSTCHKATGDKGESHRVRGRGLDLRPNDVAARFTCDSAGCHSNRPHGDYSATTGSSRDKHAMKVACQTCHITTYAKAINGVGVPTELARDWQDPVVSQTACNGRGGWLPKAYEGSNLVPSYQWFDGTSRVYYIGEPLHGAAAGPVPTKPLDAAMALNFKMPAGTAAYVLGAPNGSVASTASKLYPMKEHWGKLARHVDKDTLIAHSTFEFFRTGDFNAAVKASMADTPGMTSEDNYEVVPVHTFQTLNHGVDVHAKALQCGACHAAITTGGPVRMDLKGKLGYGLRLGPSAVQGTRQATLDGTVETVCKQCHSVKSSGRTFTSVHSRHVQDKRKDCAACHNFGRPERGLSLTSGG